MPWWTRLSGGATWMGGLGGGDRPLSLRVSRRQEAVPAPPPCKERIGGPSLGGGLSLGDGK